MKNLNKSIILAVLLALPMFIFAQDPGTEITPSGSIESSGGVLTSCPDGLTDSIWDPKTGTCKPTGPYPTSIPTEIPIRYTDDIKKYKETNIDDSFRFNLKVGEKLLVSRDLGGITITLNSLTGHTANVTVIVRGGCGPVADDRCLGHPGLEETFDLKLGQPKTIPGTGKSLTFAQKVSDTEAWFILTTSVSRPTPCPADGLWDPKTRTCKPTSLYPTPPAPEPPTRTPTPTPTHPTPPILTVSGLRIDTVTEVREIESGSYEIKGKQNGRLLFLFPIEIDVSYSLKDSAVTNVKRPWWSILVW